MSLFNDPQDLNAYGQRLTQLLLIGGYHIEEGTAEGKKLTFGVWDKAVRGEAQTRGIEVSVEQMRWLWDSLKTEPATKSQFAHLMDDGNNSAPIKVLPEGSQILINLRNVTTGFGVSSIRPNVSVDPFVEVILEDDLYMTRGKKHRLGCERVAALLVMTIYSGIDDAAMEGAKMKAKVDTVSIEGGRVTVKVGSLNQAYTKASLRLEPERQSHGGRIYDALFWLDNDGDRVSLGKIRDAVERGSWTFPGLAGSFDE